MILCGTEDTANPLADRFDGQYKHVSTVRTLSKIDLEFFRDIETFTAEQGPVKDGDYIDGLIVSLDMIKRFCGTKKYKKRVFLITDGEKQATATKKEFDSLVQQMNENDVRLNVITLDFANEFGEDSSSDQSDDQESKPRKSNPKKSLKQETK